MNATKSMWAGVVLATAGTLSWAQYPDKPVTLVVPFAAGGPSDKIARDLAAGGAYERQGEHHAQLGRLVLDPERLLRVHRSAFVRLGAVDGDHPSTVGG